MAIKRVTHCQPYLTQSQVERLVRLLDLHPRKADASLRAKLVETLSRATVGDIHHAKWLEARGR